MNFGEYLKACRIKKGYKLAKTAQMVGISSSYLSSLESGTRPAPSFDVLSKIGDVLELSVKERYHLYDLAAESKQPPVLADDLAEYINQHPAIRDMLRYSKECRLTDEDWETVSSFVKKNYFY